jgi:hypothetical protein
MEYFDTVTEPSWYMNTRRTAQKRALVGYIDHTLFSIYNETHFLCPLGDNQLSLREIKYYAGKF